MKSREDEVSPLSAEHAIQQERDVLRSDRNAQPFSALCISGGGIRSATFGLGVIQGLAERGILQQLDYLSTVSGGGYIGSWLTAWTKRTRGGVHDIAKQLASRAHAPEAASDPVRHLREYSRYLAPSAGALSWDLWTLIAGVVRNILLNWLVLLPLLLAVLLVPRAYLSLLALPEWVYGNELFPPDGAGQPNYKSQALNAISQSVFVDPGLPLLSGALFTYALFNTLRYLPSVGGRPHTRADYNSRILVPLVCAALTYLAYDSLSFLGDEYTENSHLIPVILWTSLACVCAWFLFLVLHRRPLRERLFLISSPVSLAIAVKAAGVGLATWLSTNFLLWSANPQAAPSWAFYVTVGPPVMLVGFSLATILFGGLSSGFLKDQDREWLSRSSAGVLLACFAWAMSGYVVLILPALALSFETWGPRFVVAAALLSAVLSRIQLPGPANANPEATRQSRSILLTTIVKVAPLVFIAMFAIGLSVLTNKLLHLLDNLVTSVGWSEFEVLVDSARNMRLGSDAKPHWTAHNDILHGSNLVILCALCLALIGLSWTMARYVNVNTFSLHGMYRDRLVRAYLGASNPQRKPNPFTDFDPSDDTKLADLANVRPLHLINATLNMVSSNRLAWQDRKAAPFTMSPLHCGSAELGYRDTAHYAGGISQGTAFAISGAAASPNMGYYSSAIVGFIMTLFNARLGSWLGNPGRAGDKTWKQAGPRYAVRSLVTEALGLTSGNSKYVYLSDGGHFENLGLYEAVRRRCRFIFAIDSSCDPTFTFGDLGNAIRKIRIDFGVSIDFDATLQALTARERRFAVARIRYSDVDPNEVDGSLIYLKPGLIGNEPPDVQSYAASNPTFPHQSTANQSFDESQTESYRQLGLISVREMCGEWTDGELSELFGSLRSGPIGSPSNSVSAAAD